MVIFLSPLLLLLWDGDGWPCIKCSQNGSLMVDMSGGRWVGNE